jgi:transcription elongation factor GreA-like protein
MANRKSNVKRKAPAILKRRQLTEAAPSACVSQFVFSVGDWVYHPMFGDGKIRSIRADKLTIAFAGNVTKEIREDFVRRKG